MKLRRLIVGQNVVLDLESSAATVVNIVDEIRFKAVLPDDAMAPDVLNIPISLSALVSWDAENESEVAGSGHYRIWLKTPKNVWPLMSPTGESVEVPFKGASRCNARFSINQLQYDADGDYIIEVAESNAPQDIRGSWPIRVSRIGQEENLTPSPTM